MKYIINHITDIAKIPIEHWDELFSDLRASIPYIEYHHECAKDAGLTKTLAEFCPRIEFTPDGQRTHNVMVNGEVLPGIQVVGSKDGWIPASQPPEVGVGEVLVWCAATSDMWFGQWDGDGWCGGGDAYGVVTHWMPLPKPPTDPVRKDTTT